MGTFVNRVPRFFRAAGGGECGIGFRGPVRRSISWAARDVGERGLVKVEAAGGGGRRPAFTRPRSPTTIAWRDRGAESMPGENLVVVGMRQLFMRVDLDGSRSGPGTHALDRHGGGVRRLGPSGRAEDRASGAFSFGRGLNFAPILIRSEASLYEAQAEGLHTRIRRSSGNSQPSCLIREARRPGTEGAGPILTAASFSHSPARRPAHLGRFSGSGSIFSPRLVHETLNRRKPGVRALRLKPPRPCARPRE